MRHHRVGIAQFHLGRQVRHGNAFDRQRRRRAIDRAGEDEHAVVRPYLALKCRSQLDMNFYRLRLNCRRRVCRAFGEVISGAGNAAFQCRPRCVICGQCCEQPGPVIHRRLIALCFERGNPEQTKAGDFLGVSLQHFVGQRLHLGCEVLVAGEIQRLSPLPEQLGLPSGQRHRALEHLRGITRAVLRHIAARQKIQVFG